MMLLVIDNYWERSLAKVNVKLFDLTTKQMNYILHSVTSICRRELQEHGVKNGLEISTEITRSKKIDLHYFHGKT